MLVSLDSSVPNQILSKRDVFVTIRMALSTPSSDCNRLEKKDCSAAKNTDLVLQNSAKKKMKGVMFSSLVLPAFLL